MRTFSVHELHGKGFKMLRAHGRMCNNKGAGAEVALASSGLHDPHEMWVVMAMKDWGEIVSCCNGKWDI